MSYDDYEAKEKKWVAKPEPKQVLYKEKHR